LRWLYASSDDFTNVRTHHISANHLAYDVADCVYAYTVAVNVTNHRDAILNADHITNRVNADSVTDGAANGIGAYHLADGVADHLDPDGVSNSLTNRVGAAFDEPNSEPHFIPNLRSPGRHVSGVLRQRSRHGTLCSQPQLPEQLPFDLRRVYALPDRVTDRVSNQINTDCITIDVANHVCADRVAVYIPDSFGPHSFPNYVADHLDTNPIAFLFAICI